MSALAINGEFSKYAAKNNTRHGLNMALDRFLGEGIRTTNFLGKSTLWDVAAVLRQIGVMA